MRDVSTSFLAAVSIQAANLANGILLARLLGPEGRGELAAVILWPSVIAALGGLGINDAVIYHSSPGRSRPERVYATGVVLALVQSAALVLIGAFLLPLLYADYAPEVRGAAYVYLLFIPLSLAGTYAHSILSGRLRFGAWNALGVLTAMATPLAVGAAALLAGVSVLGCAVAMVAAQAIAMLSTHVVVIRRGLAGWRPSLSLARSLFGYGLPVYVGLVGVMLNDRLDRMLISQWLAPEDFGLYVVAGSLASGAVVLATTLGNLAFPKIAAQGEADPQRGVILGRYLRFALLLTAGAALVLGVLAPWLVSLLFGAAFVEAVPIVRVLLLAMIAVAGKRILIQGFKANGRLRAVAVAEPAALLANAAALVVLLPTLGIIGAAWATVITNAIVCAGLLAHSRRALDVGAAALLRPQPEDMTAAVRQVRNLWR